MKMRKSIALCAVALVAANAVDPVLAQPRGRGGNPVYRNGFALSLPVPLKVPA